MQVKSQLGEILLISILALNSDKDHCQLSMVTFMVGRMG
jgi:hypothetical protein